MDASSTTTSATAMAHSYINDHAAQGISPADEAAIESLVNVSPSGAYKSADTTTAITATHADEPLPQQHQHQPAYADQYAYQHAVAVDGPLQQPHQSSSLGLSIDEDQKPSILQHAAQSGYPTQYATIAGHTSNGLPPPTPTSAGLYPADFTADGLPRYVLQSHGTQHGHLAYFLTGPAPPTPGSAGQPQYANYAFIPPPMQTSGSYQGGPSSQMMRPSHSSSSSASYSSTGQLQGGYTSYATSHATSPVPPGSAGSGSAAPLHSPYDECAPQSAPYLTSTGGIASSHPYGAVGLGLPRSGAGSPSDSSTSTMTTAQGKKPMRITIKPPRRVITPAGIGLLTEVRAMRVAAAAAAAAGAELVRAERGQKEARVTSPGRTSYPYTDPSISSGLSQPRDDDVSTANEDSEMSHEQSYDSSVAAGDTSGVTASSTDESFTAPADPHILASIRRPAAPRPCYPWNDVDDDILRNTMHTTMGRSWPEIARKAFPDGRHGKNDCMERWRVISKPKGQKGPWTADEDAMLLQLAAELGPEKWVIISSKMGTRTGKQCRERWHNHLDPASKRERCSV